MPRLLMRFIVAGSTFVQCLACGDATAPKASDPLCGAEQVDQYVAGIQKTGLSNRQRFRISDALPAPPNRGDNTWTVQLLDAANTAVPQTSYRLRLRPWMPDHGHGTTPLWHEGRVVEDHFEFGPFDLFMSGFWQFTVVSSTTTGEVDQVAFHFCVEG